jgi:hypothetical protein
VTIAPTDAPTLHSITLETESQTGLFRMKVLAEASMGALSPLAREYALPRHVQTRVPSGMADAVCRCWKDSRSRGGPFS